MNAEHCGCDLGCQPAYFCEAHRGRKSVGWVGVDFDGVLVDWKVEYLPGHGEPLPAGLALVRAHLLKGDEVRIFTARIEPSPDEPEWWRVASELGFKSVKAWVDNQRQMIDRFCEEHFGMTLRITAAKDWQMITCYDDRCIEMVTNSGEPRYPISAQTALLSMASELQRAKRLAEERGWVVDQPFVVWLDGILGK